MTDPTCCELACYEDPGCACEAEARADLLDRLAAGVERLPKWDKRSVPGGFHVNRAAVLALIEEARK